MDIRAYAVVLLRRWPLILLFALLAAGTAYVYGSRAPRVYRATAQLAVTPVEIDFFKGEAVQRLLTNYAARIRSRGFASEFAPRIAPGLKGEDIAGKVRAVAAPSDYRISIEVDDGDPVRAQEIANAAAFGFAERIRIENSSREKRDVDVEVLEPADVPGSPFSPRPRRDALGAALVGALLAGILAFILEFLNDTVSSPNEIQRLLGYQVLGSIPRSSPSGVLNGFFPRRRPGRSA
jgi:capsular polysaccharide biosynthesis protein